MTKYSVPALDKAIAILELLAESNSKWTITEIHTKLNIPKGTVFMIMSVLEASGVVAKDENGRFTIGVRLFKWGGAYLSKLDIVKIAHPYLEELTKVTGFASHLGKLDNGGILFLDKVDANTFIKFSTYPGMSSDLHISSLGKAIAAFLPEEELDKIIALKGLGRYTYKSIAKAETFKLALEHIRLAGYALEDEEGELGVRCIGAPVFDNTGTVVAAVSITGIRTELTEDRFVEIGEMVRNTGFAVSSELGYMRTP